MPTIPVDSIDDPRIAAYRDLPRSAAARARGLFIAEGRWLVQRLLGSDLEVVSLLVDERYAAAVAAQLSSDLPVYVTAADTVDEVIGFNFHRGVLACGKRPRAPSLHGVLETLPRAATVAICLDVQDAENLGGVLRNCAAFGVDFVLASQHCVDPFSRRVLRVSMGTAFNLTIVQSDDIRRDLDLLHRAEVQLVAAVVDEHAEPLAAADASARVAVLFGNEALGLDDQIRQLCDRQLTIPMQRGTDSLNVATASGVFLYHFTNVAASFSAR